MALSYVQVVKTSTGWSVRYQTGPRADLIKQLFGTDTLPLPYTLELSLKQATEEFIRNTKGVVSANVDGGVILR